VQTAPPVPRQTPDNSNQRAYDGKKKAAQHPNPIASTTPSQDAPKKAASEQAPTNQPASPNAEQPIRIRELPSVSVTKDWMDKATWIFGAILVVVGIVGVRAAFKTLQAIEHQAEIMRGQLTVPYRAYLSVIEPEKPVADRIKNINRTKFPIVNTGHVRARITAIDVEVIVQARGGKELFRRSRIETVKAKEGEIPPEKSSSYAVTVLWPSDIPNAEDTVISIAITYNTGFKELKPDTFSFVRVFTTSTQDWSKGYWGADIDLTQAQDDKKNPN